MNYKFSVLFLLFALEVAKLEFGDKSKLAFRVTAHPVAPISKQCFGFNVFGSLNIWHAIIRTLMDIAMHCQTRS